MTTDSCERVQESPVSPDGRVEEARADAKSIRACFGRRWVSPELLGRLQAGSVLELDSDASSPVEIFADGRLAGFGSAVVVDLGGPGQVAERRLCIRLDRKAEPTGAETK